MVKPRNQENARDLPRTTVRAPKADAEFGGWGPRLRY